MNNPQILLNDILKLKKDLEAQDVKLPSGLAGMYGEILVVQKLQQVFRGTKFSVHFYAGHKGADIQLVGGRDKIHVEVKTSRLKEEGFGMWYGAALNIKRCKKHADACYGHPKRGKVNGDFCYFDHVVFVALSEDLSGAKFYIIPRRFIENNEKLLRNTHKRFSNSTHRIIISSGNRMPDMPAEQKRLIRATEKFRDRWELIANRPDAVRGETLNQGK